MFPFITKTQNFGQSPRCKYSTNTNMKKNRIDLGSRSGNSRTKPNLEKKNLDRLEISRNVVF